VSPTDDFMVRQMWLNRQKPEIVKVFQNILGTFLTSWLPFSVQERRILSFIFCPLLPPLLSPSPTKSTNSFSGEEQVRVSKDRWGVMRPTKQVRYPDGSVKDKDEWRTLASWLHWDQNPWMECNIRRLQVCSSSLPSSPSLPSPSPSPPL
jgi:hypothetical protein